MKRPCTCLPRSPDDQCPTHGYEAYLREVNAVALDVLEYVTEAMGKDGYHDLFQGADPSHEERAG